jgi:DNA-binding transcriptional MerR regulator
MPRSGYTVRECERVAGISHETIRGYMERGWLDYRRDPNDGRGTYLISEDSVRLLTFMKQKFESTQLVTVGLGLMQDEPDTREHVRKLMAQEA